jgi:signal transduction histidine kinase
MGNLIAGISHELNNPVAVILGFAQGLLEETSGEDPERWQLAAIERQAQRCSRLLKKLLNFARKRAEKTQQLSVEALVSSVLALLKDRQPHAGVVFDVALAATLPEIEGSITDLESVLVNLLENSLAALPQGGKIELRAQAATRAGRDGVELIVRDHGVGISPEGLEHIFEPFYTTREVGHGTGLGLSMVHKAVESHGGQIAVESTLGQGTTVSIWLPAALGGVNNDGDENF